MTTDQVALLLAALSLLVAGISLGWHILSHVLDGARPQAKLQHGALGRGGAAMADIRNGGPRDLDLMTSQGYTEEVLGVKVVNRGRAPAVVERYGVVHEASGMSFHPVGDAIGVALPHRLGPGTSETWFARMTDVHALAYASDHLGAGRRVYMTVELGTGKQLRTKSMTLAPETITRASR